MSDVSPILVIDVRDAEEALEAILPRALALPTGVLQASALPRGRFDILDVVTVTLQVARRLAASGGEILSHTRLTPDNIAAFECMICALYASELRHLRTTLSHNERWEIVGRARAWAHLLRAEEDALVVQGWLTLEGSKRKPSGPRERSSVSRTLARLTQRFRKAWPAIEGYTQLRSADILEAERTAFLTLGVTGEGPRVGEPEARDLRARVHHLVVKRYEEIRRALHYVRMDWGDADQIAPPLASRAEAGTGPEHRTIPPSVNCTPTTHALHPGTTNEALAFDTHAGFRRLVEILKSKSLAN